jgi:YfiH family protein
MFAETKPGILQSQLFNSDERIIHAYTTRFLGDMRTSEPRARLKTLLGVSSFRTVGAKQVHGTDIHIVREEDFGKTVQDVDGLVAAQNELSQHVLLGVITADCVPILFADAKQGIVGAAHSGWRGTLGRIGKYMIETMQSLGSDPKDIVVGIGPHIGPCCYDVQADRAQVFTTAFDATVVSHRDGRSYLDLAEAVKQTVLASGVRPEHTDQSEVCTASNPHVLYSYRNKGQQPYGEQIAVIGVQ